jgi:hypothetical protein
MHEADRLSSISCWRISKESGAAQAADFNQRFFMGGSGLSFRPALASWTPQGRVLEC